MSNLHDHVRVKNESDVELHLKYDSKPYIVPKNGDALVPAECAAIWFGDWDKRNTDRRPARRKEVDRLRGLYGCHEGFPGNEERWEERKPKVKLFTPDNEPIVGILDDPEGKNLPAASGDANSALIEQMRARLDEQEARMQEMTGGLEDIPTDSPETGSKRKKRSAPIEPAREETG